MVASIFASQQPAFRNPYDPAANALFARMTVQPNNGRKKLISDTIVSFKAAGVWDKMGMLYLLAAHDAQAARLNWKGPYGDLTPINTPTFTVDQGYQGDASTSYLDTGLSPANPETLWTQDSAHLGMWSRSVAPANSSYQSIGQVGSSKSYVVPRSSADQIAVRMNQTLSSLLAPATTARGHTTGARLSSANTAAHRDGAIASSSNTIPSVAMDTGNFAILRAALFSGYQISAAHFGMSVNTAENTAIYSALQSYLAAVGGT